MYMLFTLRRQSIHIRPVTWFIDQFIFIHSSLPLFSLSCVSSSITWMNILFNCISIHILACRLPVFILKLRAEHLKTLEACEQHFLSLALCILFPFPCVHFFVRLNFAFCILFFLSPLPPQKQGQREVMNVFQAHLWHAYFRVDQLACEKPESINLVDCFMWTGRFTCSLLKGKLCACLRHASCMTSFSLVNMLMSWSLSQMSTDLPE